MDPIMPLVSLAFKPVSAIAGRQEDFASFSAFGELRNRYEPPRTHKQTPISCARVLGVVVSFPW